MIVHAVTDNDLHPPRFGATQRLFGLLRGLARAHRVTALCVVPNRNRAPREESVAGVQLLRRKAWYTAVTWRLERAGLAPLLLAAHGHRARARQLLAQLPGAADVLMTDLSVAGLLERSRAHLRVYHAHNVEAEHFRIAGPRLFAGGRWAAHLAGLERRATEKADLVIAACAEDAEQFHALYQVPEDKLAVIPNGFDETVVGPPADGAREVVRETLEIGLDETVALFLGSDVPHNRAALAHLCDRVMPRVGAARMRLLVVGSVARALAGRREPWLMAHDEVSDLRPIFAASDVGLNPVTTGGGSNVKLPTYLAAGLAVITTPFGLRGYADLAPWVLQVEAEAFAEALATRPHGWYARGEAAPAPLAGYAWGGLGERLGHTFEARLAPATGAAQSAPARDTGSQRARAQEVRA